MGRWWLAAPLLCLPGVTVAQSDGRGVQVQVSGGVVAFPGADVGPGAAWGISAGLAPWEALEVELGYQGAAYTADALVPSQSTAALQNGGYGALKLAAGARSVRPYLLAGIGISHINAVDESIEGDAIQDDTIGKAPVGLGVDVRFDVFSLGLRGTYDFVFFNQFALQTGTARGADQLFGSLNLGATF